MLDSVSTVFPFSIPVLKLHTTMIDCGTLDSDIPQGLKPVVAAIVYGPTKVVP